MKIKLSNREKFLGVTLLILITISIVQLRNGNKIDENQDSLEIKENIKIDERVYFNGEKDIVLKIENEIKNIVNINYINKNSYTDEYNNQDTNIELHVSGKFDDILKIERSLKNIGLEKSINKIEIVKNTKSIKEEDTDKMNDYVDCILEIKVV